MKDGTCDFCGLYSGALTEILPCDEIGLSNEVTHICKSCLREFEKGEL